MVSVTIDGVSIAVEQGVEWVEDGTEEFDLGTLLIVNSTQRETYPDYADVVMTFNSETIYACIRQDISTRTSVGTTDKYEHRIKLAELVIKLSQYPHADRLFTTKSGAKTTYKVHLQDILNTAFYGKTSPITVATATLTALTEDADEKEYSGGDLLKTTVDIFRSLGLVPTLSITNEIGHKDIRQQGDLVIFTRKDAEIITSDIKDYAMKVYSKVKKATFEADLITGGTYYPDANSGVTVRTSKTKYIDEDAEFILDSGIRKVIEARILNVVTVTSNPATVISQIEIVSKEEWDDLTIELDAAVLETGKYKNNTPYFIEGNNIIQNVGTTYNLYNKVPPTQNEDALSQAVRRSNYIAYGSGEYIPATMRNYEASFYYQVQRDMDVVQERHDLDRVGKVSTIINQQKDSKLELARFGNANKQLINRMGNDTYQITVRYFDKNTPTYFQVGDYTANGYRIIKRQFLLRDSSQDVTYLLTKNQSILNPNTSVKRNFVSPFTISKRNIITNFVYEEYFQFSATQGIDDTNDQNIRLIILNALNFASAFDNPIYNCQYLRDATAPYINMSVAGIPMGNSFEFHAQFNHPKFAGYQLVSDGATGYKTNPISYGDANGEIDTAALWFMNSSTTSPTLHPVATFNLNWQMKIDSETVALNPDEIFAMTYVKHCITDDENLFVGDYFLQNNSLIKELGVAQGISVVYYPDNPKYTIYDQVRKTGFSGFGTLSVDGAGMYFEVGSIPTNYSWAIVKSTAPYNVYFAYNNTGTDKTRIYLNLLKNRPNTETL